MNMERLSSTPPPPNSKLDHSAVAALDGAFGETSELLAVEFASRARGPDECHATMCREARTVV